MTLHNAREVDGRDNCLRGGASRIGGSMACAWAFSSLLHIYHSNRHRQAIRACLKSWYACGSPWSPSIPLSRNRTRPPSVLGLPIDRPQTRREGRRQPHAQRMEMVNGPVPPPEVEARLDARFDVPHGHFHRVRDIVGSIGGFGEGDAGGDCCCSGR